MLSCGCRFRAVPCVCRQKGTPPDANRASRDWSAAKKMVIFKFVCRPFPEEVFFARLAPCEKNIPVPVFDKNIMCVAQPPMGDHAAIFFLWEDNRNKFWNDTLNLYWFFLVAKIIFVLGSTVGSREPDVIFCGECL